MTTHRKGTVYFMVSYPDDDSLVPVMDTVVYLGERADSAEARHMFQDFESWKERGEYPNTTEGPGKVFSLPPSELSNIQPLNAALEELNSCLARRQKRG